MSHQKLLLRVTYFDKFGFALQAGNTLKLDVIIKNSQAIIDKAEALRGEGSGPAARSQIASEK